MRLFSESVAAAINAAVAWFHGLHEKIGRQQTKLQRLMSVVRQGDGDDGYKKRLRQQVKRRHVKQRRQRMKQRDQLVHGLILIIV